MQVLKKTKKKKPGIPPATALESNKQSWCRAFKVIFPLFNISGCSYKTQ